MNSKIALSFLNNPHLSGQDERIDEAIDFLIKENQKLVTQLDSSKYQNIINRVIELKVPKSTYLYSFSQNEMLNTKIFHLYNLLAIFLKIKKILKTSKDSSFDIILTIDEQIDEDLRNFDAFLSRPSFMNEKLRSVDDSTEDKNKILLYDDSAKGLVFQDRTIDEYSGGETVDDSGFKRFQEKKQLYDSMTSYINSETVFSQDNQDTIFNFQYLINNYFNRFVEKYLEKNPELNNKLKFFYKGGTTMGILYWKYNELSGDLFKDYNKFFKRSDSDYSLQLDSKTPDYDKYYVELTILKYNIIQSIKKFMNRYSHYLLPTDKINNKEKLIEKLYELNNIIDNGKKEGNPDYLFNNVKKIVGLTVDRSTYMIEEIPSGSKFINFNKQGLAKADIGINVDELNKNGKLESSHRNDFYITIKGNNPVLIQLGSNESPLYYYTNESNYFVRKSTLSNFNLSRVKYNFIVYMRLTTGEYSTINVPSEIIDVPIPKKNDFKIKSVNLKDDIKSYQIKVNDDLLIYNSYTIKAFITDIYKALFSEVTVPWLAGKYQKKIERVFFLLQVNLGNRLSQDEFDKLQEEIRKNMTPDNFVVDVNPSKFNAQTILDKTLLKEFIEKLNGVTCKSPRTKECENFGKLVYEKMTNLKFFKFTNTGVDDNRESVPYLKKYLKYKNKYLELKENLKKMNLN